MNDQSLSNIDLGMRKKTLGMYSFGMILSILLTLIPFGCAYYKLVPYTSTVLIILSCAVMQFLVQVVCFLGLSFKNDQGKINILSFFFTIFVLFIIVGGSMWIMNHLNYNMM